MSPLTLPPPRDQVRARDADRFELCGESCLASALGLDVESVTAWLRQHEGGERAVHSGTTPQVLIDFCRSRGIGAQVVRGPAAQYVAGAVARGHYALVLVWSDHQGNPVPLAQSARLHVGGIGHWLLGYGTAGSSVDVMQPWGGRLLRYNLGGGRDQQLGVEIDRAVAVPVPVARPVAKPAPPVPPKPAPPKPVPPKPAPRLPFVPALPKPAPPMPAPPTPAPPKKAAGRVYVVKHGDTLSAIAAAQRVTLQALLRANPQIKNPNLILVGQRITIPT